MGQSLGHVIVWLSHRDPAQKDPCCFNGPYSQSVLAPYTMLPGNNLTSQRFISGSYYRALTPLSPRTQTMRNLGTGSISHQDRQEWGFHVLTQTMIIWPTSGKVTVPAFQWLAVVAY